MKSKFYIQAGWDDAPHLSGTDKEQLLASCEPHLREARSKGIPSMGSGAIYPFREEDILTSGVRLEPWFRRAYGMDVGWNCTAVVWGALDPDTDILYIYDCYAEGEARPEVHAGSIKKRDFKKPYMRLPGAIDPASQGSSQVDGQKLLQLYRAEGLHLIEADNSLESGIYEVYSRFASGRLKIFNNPNTEGLMKELRTYRRDEKGKIVNKPQYHRLDGLRYLVTTGLKIAKAQPVENKTAPGLGYVDYGV